MPPAFFSPEEVFLDYLAWRGRERDLQVNNWVYVVLFFSKLQETSPALIS